MNENDIFMTSIEVKKVRNIESFTIPLSETERKHLIITGENGSGKTSLLNEINKYLNARIKWRYEDRINISVIPRLKQKSDDFGKNININFKNTDFLNPKFKDGNYILSFFESKRLFNLDIPKGIKKIDLKKNYTPTEKINENFIQYIVNLKAERSFSKDDNDYKVVAEIDAWFENFETRLKELFDASDLQLIFDRKNYNFHIQIGNNEVFTLTQLSDGYSAVLTIVTELILRMESTGMKDVYNTQGVVLIDEIETHLHVALQKKIMPFLCAFFPNIQFIVTTHSPFVISSLENAVVCDLERKEVVSDLSGYSYDALVESYFGADKYSQQLKNKVQIFELLSEKQELSEEEEEQYYELNRYFKDVPKFHADELALKLQQIKFKRMTRQG